jgi:hypothetical protein
VIAPAAPTVAAPKHDEAAPAPAPTKSQAPAAAPEPETTTAAEPEVAQPSPMDAGEAASVDAELDALLASLGGPEPESAASTGGEEALDPALAALLADL